jgi:putative FmdB family regulatory protein
MPKFTFECECGSNFSRTLKMSEDNSAYACPSCGKSAPRLWEKFGFNFAPGGKAPANSGVTKHDYPTDDIVVGMDADKRWAEYRARERVKTKVREVGGNRALVRKNAKDHIEYTAGTQETIDTRKKVRDEIVTALKRPPA